MGESTQAERLYLDQMTADLDETDAAPISTRLLRKLLNDADRLAEIERQVIYRTEDMPSTAFGWEKTRHGLITYWYFVPDGGFCHVDAPDYRRDEPGPLWVPIIDAPDAGKGE